MVLQRIVASPRSALPTYMYSTEQFWPKHGTRVFAGPAKSPTRVTHIIDQVTYRVGQVTRGENYYL